MTRLLCSVFLAFSLCVIAAPPRKAVPLTVEGNTVMVVKSFPVMIKAPPGKGLFLWSFPDSVKADYDPEAENVLIVKTAPKGSHTIRVVQIRYNKEKDEFEKDKGETVIVVGDGGVPPPDVDPDVPPPDAKGPLRVLIVIEEEQSATYPKEQQSIFYSKKIEDHFNAKTDIDPVMKRKRWNIWDQNAVVTAAPKEWQDAMKRERKSLPWIIMFGDGAAVYYEGPLPKTVDETIALVDKYAPKKGGKP